MTDRPDLPKLVGVQAQHGVAVDRVAARDGVHRATAPVTDVLHINAPLHVAGRDEADDCLATF